MKKFSSSTTFPSNTKKAVFLLCSFVFIFLFFYIFIPSSSAAVYSAITYQGKLVDATGAAIADGGYNVRFRVYDSLSGGTLLWTETWDGTTSRATTSNGIFSVNLNSICASWTGACASNGGVDFNTNSLYLQIEFDPGNDDTYEETFSPRKRLTSAPYAINSDLLDGQEGAYYRSWDNLTSKPATSTVLNLLDTQSRISALNSTTTNVGTLNVYTSLAGVGFDNAWKTAYNATTTLNGFTNNQTNWNTAFGWGNHASGGYASSAGMFTKYGTLAELQAAVSGDFHNLGGTDLTGASVGAAWQQIWTGAITPTTTNAGIYVNASSTISDLRVSNSLNATTTNVGTLNVYGLSILPDARISVLNSTTTNIGTLRVYNNATTTGSMSIGQLSVNNAYWFPSTSGSSGQVLKNDGSGNLTWQADATGASAGAAWEQVWTGAIRPTTTTAGIYVAAASSTLVDLRVNGSLNATTTNVGNLTAYSLSVLPDTRISVLNATTTNFGTINAYGLSILPDARLSVLNSTTTNIGTLNVITQAFSPLSRITMLNSTSTNIGTLMVYNNATTTGSMSIGQLSVNNAYWFPSTSGSSGQVLKNDGSGNLTWQADNTGASAGAAWEQAWIGAVRPTTTTAGIYVAAASSTLVDLRVNGSLNATTTNIGTLSVYGNASTTGNATTTGSFTAGSTLYVKHQGAVGIATTTPGGAFAEKFTVSGSSYFDGNATVTATLLAEELQTGAMAFETDAGVLPWMDEQVTSAAALGTVEGYTAGIDSNNMFTLYAESDANGGIQRPSIGIATTTPGGYFGEALTVVDSAHIIRTASGTETLFVVGTSTADNLLVVKSNGTVGIGFSLTTAPTSTLSVLGNANFSGNATTSHSFSAGGILYVKHQGIIGIATTTPWENYQLAVAGNTVFSGSVKITNNATTTNSVIAGLGYFGTGVQPNSTTTLRVNGASYLEGNATTTGVLATQKIHVRDGNFVVDTPTNPKVVGTYGPTATAWRVNVSGKYAYLTDATSGLRIIDIATSTSPAQVGIYNTAGNAYDVKVVGKYAYVADGTSGLQIIDISNPNSPTLTATYDTPGTLGALGIYVSGRYAYINDDSTLQIIDISNPASPIFAGSVALNGTGVTGSAFGIYVLGKYAYIANGTKLQIVDISNPASPSITGSYTATACIDVYVSGRYAYIADTGSSLRIIDISNPASPTLTSTLAVGTAYGVYVSGRYAYVAATGVGLKIVDVYTASAPALVATLDLSGNALGISVSGRYAYVADQTTGLRIVDIKGADINSLAAGSVTINTLTVTDNIDIGNNLYVRSGLNVGPGGIFTNGGITASTTSVFAGSVGVATTTPGGYFGEKLTVVDSAHIIRTGGGTESLFVVGTSTADNLLVVKSNGTVGIGFSLTTAPTSTLSVLGNANFSGNATTSHSFSAGGTFYVKHQGAVGIATTTPGGAYAEKFTVSGNSYFDGNATTTGSLMVEELQTGKMSFEVDGGTLTWMDLPVTSASAAGTVESYVANIDANNLFTLYSESDGTGGIQRPSIGIATTTPGGYFGEALTVVDSAHIIRTASGTETLFVVGTSTADNLLVVRSNGTVGIGLGSGSATAPTSTLSVLGNANFSGNATTSHSFSAGGTLYVKHQGVVGIATTTPWEGYELAVAGDIVVTGDIAKNGTSYANPDWVYEKYYNNQLSDHYDLTYVENFVQTQYHLPWASSTEEIQGGLVKFGDLIAKNTELTERLSLYIIDLHKRLGIIEGNGNQNVVNMLNNNVAELTVTENAEFKGKVIVKDHIYFNNDTAGQVMIKAGAKKVKVTFNKAYDIAAPIINATLFMPDPENTTGTTTDWATAYDLRYAITEQTKEGFTISIKETLSKDVMFNWQATAVEEPKLYVSDGSVEAITEPTQEPPVINEPTPILGCTNSAASNYNVEATQDDGSCIIAPVPVLGCTNPDATNYNVQATQDDGSCITAPAPILGCTNSAAPNYNAAATQDDGSCQLVNPE